MTAKFALASSMEVFGEYGGVQDGSTVWELYVSAEAIDRVKYYNNTARSWWLRSPNGGSIFIAHGVNHSGESINTIASYSNGVAVACKIAKSS